MRRICLLTAAAAVLLLLPAAASADTTVAMRGVAAPGPAKYDKVFVTKIGPARAKTVLVLMPGFAGGAGDFTLVGQDIVKRVSGLQVWAVDRRSQAIEDTSMFVRGLRGQASLQEVFDYYLGWLSDKGIRRHFRPPSTKSLSFMAGWGLPTAIGDVHDVIAAARRQGKRVILGGHSLGASMTAIYATWDFGGRPGYKDLDGLVLIDGGALGTFDRVTSAADLRKRLAAIRRQPLADLVGLGLPWAQGVFAGVAGLYAYQAPLDRSVFADFPLLPARFKPPVVATNRAALGYAFDASTSPPELALIHLRSGHLAASGDPRDWVDDGPSPIERVSRFWAANPVNGVEWYFPLRLSLDVDGANELARTATARTLHLRTWHLRDVNIPLYAFQTDLTDGRVLQGARRFIARSKVPAKRSVLVDRGSSTSHLDPLTAAPATNDFLKTVVPYLRRTMRR